MRELTEQSGYSMRQILTIASMVEREAVLPEEQAQTIYQNVDSGLPVVIY